MFSCTYEAAGASNVKMWYPVPTTPPTVSSAVRTSVVITPAWQATDVPDVQDDVSQGADPSAAVAV